MDDVWLDSFHLLMHLTNQMKKMNRMELVSFSCVDVIFLFHYPSSLTELESDLEKEIYAFWSLKYDQSVEKKIPLLQSAGFALKVFLDDVESD